MDNLSQFLAEMPPLESLSKQELVERVQEAERKWLEEQRINMELVYEMETDVQEQKITTLRQRVAELEKERSDLMQSIHDQADAYDDLCAEIELSDELQRRRVKTLTAERDALKQQIASLKEAKEHIKMQARLWKFEARSQAATVRECYQACTGSTGEPGDWNGALPIQAVVKERDKATQYWQIAEGRCDALKKQMDELENELQRGLQQWMVRETAAEERLLELSRVLNMAEDCIHGRYEHNERRDVLASIASVKGKQNAAN